MAIEADLSDPGTPAGRFDAADQHIGPVEILMNNATGPLKDTFTAAGTDRFARTLEPVSPTSWSRQFAVDVQAAALLISEFAQRPIAHRGTRGPRRSAMGPFRGGESRGACGGRGFLVTIRSSMAASGPGRRLASSLRCFGFHEARPF